MNSQNPHRAAAAGWSWTNILRDLTATWRLLWDPSVPGFLKLALPFLALAYWVWPIDLIPGIPLDDIAVLMVLARLFVALAPNDSVNRAFNGWGASTPRNPNPANPNTSRSSASKTEDGEIIETTWRVVE